MGGAITAVPLIQRADQLGKLDVNGKSANTFDGKGSTENSNGTSRASSPARRRGAAQRAPHHLGREADRCRQNVDILKFSGQIDPVTIQPGNTVSSTQIANVRIEQKGRGAQSDAQGIGWLARFFLNILPF